MAAMLMRCVSQEQLLEVLPGSVLDDGRAEVTYQHNLDQRQPADDQQTEVGAERQLLKNTAILGTGFVFVFSAFLALQSLQSSLFLETGLGLHVLTTLYAVTSASCLYGPVFVQKLTPNWTIVLAFVMMALFISTFFYPRLYTLLPSAVLLGLVLGPLFCARTTFLMQLVSRMTFVTEGIREKVQRRYLRLFYLFFDSSRIWGNLVAALLLHYRSTETPSQAAKGSDNSTQHHRTLAACKRDQHDWERDFMVALPHNTLVVMVSVYLAAAVVGLVLVMAGLDRFPTVVQQDPMERPLCLQTSRKIGLAFTDPHLRLLYPFVLFIGLEQGFIVADFTRSYVLCILGLESVVYTMMCMGATNTLGSIAVHQFSKHIKRLVILTAGLIFQAGLLMVLWLWRPVRDDVAVFYVIASGWGLCHAIWETLTTSYLVSRCGADCQPPFSAYFLVQATGMAVQFGYSLYLRVDLKVCLLAAGLGLAIVPYSVLEFRLHAMEGRTVAL